MWHFSGKVMPKNCQREMLPCRIHAISLPLKHPVSSRSRTSCRKNLTPSNKADEFVTPRGVSHVGLIWCYFLKKFILTRTQKIRSRQEIVSRKECPWLSSFGVPRTNFDQHHSWKSSSSVIIWRSHVAPSVGDTHKLVRCLGMISEGRTWFFGDTVHNLAKRKE